jgi:hypothetical protein
MATIGQAVVNDPFEPPSRRVPGLPTAFDQVLQRALRKVPGERFPSALAFALAIQSAMPPAEIVARRPDRRRAGRLALGGAGATILVAAGVGALLWFGKTTPVPVAPEVPAQSAYGPQVHAAPALSVVAQVAALPCSTVTVQATGASGVTSFQGIIGSGAPHDALDAIVGQVSPSSVNVAVQTFPRTDLSCRLAELVRANAGDGGARLSNGDGHATLLTGEEIRLRLNMPTFEGEVRLDDLSSDGQVSHLMEANFGAPPRYQAGAMVGLGPGGDDLVGRVSPPYGTDIVFAIVSSKPLFAVRRPVQEDGEKFINELAAAMAALRQAGGHVAADALVLTTAQR